MAIIKSKSGNRYDNLDSYDANLVYDPPEHPYSDYDSTFREPQAPNVVFAGPASGSPAIPTMRLLVSADIPGGGGGGAVSSVAGKTGAVTLVEGDITNLTTDLAGKATSAQGTKADSAVQTISLATPSILYSTPVTFSITAGAATGTLTLNTQNANRFLAGPTTGSAASPTMRAIVVGDLPTTSLHIDSHYGTITADTDGATITFDLSASDKHSVTLGGTRTLAVSNATVGQTFMLILSQDGGGSKTVTWFSGIKWAGGSAPTLTTTASKADMFTFVCYGTNLYYGMVSGQNF